MQFHKMTPPDFRDDFENPGSAYQAVMASRSASGPEFHKSPGDERYEPCFRLNEIGLKARLRNLSHFPEKIIQQTAYLSGFSEPAL
jgi:hypothetical protein